MHTSLSKKLLAGLLSLVMVLSLVAPSMGTQAASKYSLTDKKSVKSGVTYKYQLKGVSKNQYVKVTRNVSGETVKYNKKAVSKTTKIKGTGKTLNLYVTYGEKAKNYTGKFTVKVYSKKTNKVAKTLVEKVTVKVPEKEAVTSVAINNTTPRVGDTINATVEPADAINVSYKWYTGDTAANISTEIPGATGSSLEVTETMVGKFIQVIVTGKDGSTANAATIVAVQAKEAAEIAIDAKQTHAKVVEVTYTTGTPSTANTYTVTKGSQTLKVASSKTKENVVELTMSENLTDGEFKVVAKTSAGKTAEATFTGAKPVLTEVKFTNNNLSVSANTTEGLVKGYAHITSNDQFGDHMNLTSPSFTVSKGDASFKSDTGVLTLDATNTSDATYRLGEMVVVSVMYDNNTKVVPATLTVTTASMAKTITFGDIQSDDAKNYPTDKITQSNLARGVYYFPVTEAKDDAGIVLDADRLNDMIEAKTVFVTPDSQTGTIIYADRFTEKTVDGKKIIALVVKGGTQLKDLNAGVTMNLTVFSIGGAQNSLPVVIERDAVIKDINIDIPDLYAGKKSTIKLAATDTNGNAVDLYKVTKNNSLVSNVGPLTATNSAVLNFYDTANPVNVGTKINISTSMNCDWELVRNATNHSVSLNITPSGSEEGYLNMTGTTAAYTAVTKANIKINKSAYIDSVVGFSGAIATRVLNTTAAPQTLSGNNTKLGKNDGSSIGGDLAGAICVVNDAALKAASSAQDDIVIDGAQATAANVTIDAGTDTVPQLVYSMEIVGKELTKADGTSGTPAQNVCYVGNGFVLAGTAASTKVATSQTGAFTIAPIATAATGTSDTVKISLYKVSASGDNTDAKDTKVELLGTKSIVFTVENEDTAQYKIALDKYDNILYAGEVYNGTSYADTIPVYITTANGAYVNNAKLDNVSIVNKNKDGAKFVYDAGTKTIHCSAKSDAAQDKVLEATINATISSDGDTVPVTATFKYKTEAPVVTHVGVFADSTFTIPVAGNKVLLNVANGGVDTSNHKAVIGNGKGGVYIQYQDQYYTDAEKNGIVVSKKATNYIAADDTPATSVANWAFGGTAAELEITATDADGEAGDTFQVVLNGGISLTLYCTVGVDGLDINNP